MIHTFTYNVMIVGRVVATRGRTVTVRAGAPGLLEELLRKQAYPENRRISIRTASECREGRVVSEEVWRK